MTAIWVKNKPDQDKTFLDPPLQTAISRPQSIRDHSNPDLLSIGVLYEEKLIAFARNELGDRDYSICHFMQGDNSFKGIYTSLVSESRAG